MKKFSIITTLFIFFLSIPFAHAAEVIWDGEYSSLSFVVGPNGGDFLTTSPFSITNSGATDDLSYDESQGGGNVQLSSVASGSLTELGGAIQLDAEAKGPVGGVNPPNGTAVQAFAQTTLNEFQEIHGVIIRQGALSEISRKFSVDSPDEYELDAYLNGDMDFQSFGTAGTAYHAVYTFSATVSIDRYIVQGGALTFAGTIASTDLDTADRGRSLPVQLSPTTEEGNAIVYYLIVFLKLETDIANIGTGYTIAGPLEGPFQLGTATAPFELGAFVRPKNTPPTADAGPDQSVTEAATVTLDASGSMDPDGTLASYNWTQSAGTPVLLSDATSQTPNFQAPTFDSGDPLDGTGEALVFQLEVTDDREGSAMDTVIINVTDVNQPPVANAGTNQSVDERELVLLDGSASSDPDGTLSAFLWTQTAGTPVGLSNNAVAEPSFTAPSIAEESQETLAFELEVTDDGGLKWTDDVIITVSDANDPPELDEIAHQTVNEGELLQFTVSATDPEGGNLTYTAEDLQDVLTFNPQTQTFTWTPGYEDAGVYPVEIVVTDDGVPPQGDSQEINITVNDVNRPPVLDVIGNKDVDEGAPLEFTISATDPDGDSLTFSASGVPNGASFDPDTQTFSWTTGFGDNGSYQVVFSVSDNGIPQGTATEEITISVGDVNRPPVLDTIGNKEVTERDVLQFPVSATDPDSADILTITANQLPQGATLTENGNGNASFAWTPGYEDIGEYEVVFSVTDDGTPQESDSETITITVIPLPNNPPATPILLSPENGQTDLSPTPTLTTTGETGYYDPDGDAHDSTQWQISDSSDFSSLILDITAPGVRYSLTVPESVLDKETTYYWRVRYMDVREAVSDWSAPWSFSSGTGSDDQNDNGIPDGQEVDAEVDLNQDGTPDNDQPDVIKSVETVYANGQMGVVPVENVAAVETLKAIDPDDIGNKPADMTLGLIGFKVKLLDKNNPIAKVDVYISKALADQAWHKYDTITGWQDYSANAQFNADLTVVTLTLEDGGKGDADGTVNGTIVDPSGPAAPAPTPPAPAGDTGGGGGGCFVSSAAY